MICYFSPQHCLATILIGWTFVNAVAGRGVPIQEASQKAQRSVLPDLYEASITELQVSRLLYYYIQLDEYMTIDRLGWMLVISQVWTS